MKKSIFFVMLLASILSLNAQSCPTSLNLTSQSAIDNFIIDYPNCHAISGDLFIGGSNITNLNGLSNLHYVEGMVYIANSPQLQSLSGLDALIDVGGNLIITNNNALINLSGLGSLQSVGGLRVNNNNNLVQLTGMAQLSSVANNLEVYNNNVLTNLNGLNHVSTIGQDLYIFSNNALSSTIGLDNLQIVEHDIDVHSNNQLLNLEGFAALNKVRGSIKIFDNSTLTMVGELTNLEHVGSFIIAYNPQILSIGVFDNLSYCDTFFIANNSQFNSFGKLPKVKKMQNLRVEYNPRLKNMRGLDSLQQIYEIFLQDNDSLINLVGLSRLDTITGGITILHNASISSLMGLDSLHYAYYIEITYNKVFNSFEGMSELSKVNYLIIQDNDSLQNCHGLEHLQQLGRDTFNNIPIDYRGYIRIFRNKNFASLEGLENLKAVYGSIIFEMNDSLKDISALQGLKYIGEHLYISTCGYCTLNNLKGLDSLQHIEGDLVLRNGNFNFNKLQHLDSIGRDFIFYNNMGATNLDSLSNLRQIGRHLSIEYTDLVTLEGLGNTTIGGNLEITGNFDLDYCHIEPICNYLSSPNGTVTIHNNGWGGGQCQSQTQVRNLCPNVSNGHIVGRDEASRIYPNPANEILNIELPLFESGDINITLTDMLGRVVQNQVIAQGSTFTSLNTGSLQNGVYVVNIRHEDTILLNDKVTIMNP